MATSLDHSYWQAKDAELIADLANATTNYREELKWRRTAYGKYRKAGKLDNSLFSLCDLSAVYLNLHDTVQARELDDSLAFIIRQHPEIPGLREYCMFNSLFINSACGSLETADSLYNILDVAGRGYSDFPSFSIVRAYLLMQHGRHGECRQLLDSLSAVIINRNEKPMLFNTYIMLASETGDMGLMTRYTDSMLNMQQRIISDALMQTVTATQRDYLRTVADVQKAARRKSDMVAVSILAISIIVVGVVLWMYRLHSKRKQRELEEKVIRIMEISEQLEHESLRNKVFQKEIDTLRKTERDMRLRHDGWQIEHDRMSEERKREQVELKRIGKDMSKLNSRLSAARSEISTLYTRQWKTLNMLCKDFFNDKNAGKPASEVIVANIDRELEKMKSTRFLKQLEKELDTYSDGIIGKLRSQCPVLKDEDIRFCVLTIAGLSSTAVALLTGLTMRRYYSKKQNIIDRILRQNPIDKGLFMDALK